MGLAGKGGGRLDCDGFGILREGLMVAEEKMLEHGLNGIVVLHRHLSSAQRSPPLCSQAATRSSQCPLDPIVHDSMHLQLAAQQFLSSHQQIHRPRLHQHRRRQPGRWGCKGRRVARGRPC